MWFEQLTGFPETTATDVRRQLVVNGDKLASQANGRTWTCGTLDVPRLAELRDRVAKLPALTGTLTIAEVVADVQALHVDPQNAGAMFQVASQFNLLEMVGPSVTPDAGVDGYEHDRTQGPACAIACGAGTVYRNYFADVDGHTGQTAKRQIDCLAGLGTALGNSDNRFWTMQNGYALATSEGLQEITARLKNQPETERDNLRGLLRIGVHGNTQVTLNESTHTVTQAFCSALPVAYSNHSAQQWSAFAKLILEAAYEATFAAAVLNAAATGNNNVFLTLLGGGAFGNSTTWILSAIGRAVKLFRDYDLNIKIVSYRRSRSDVQQFLNALNDRG